MGASFRNTQQIEALCGCDLLTISPGLLEKMTTAPGAPVRYLSEDSAMKVPDEKISLTEKQFRWMHNEDEMANDKLSEGIRKFAIDAGKLDDMIKEKLSA